MQYIQILFDLGQTDKNSKLVNKKHKSTIELL